MKNLFLIIFVSSTVSLSLQAQDYTQFEWDIARFGYVIPSGDGTSGGIALGTEVRYNVNNTISAGLRYEFAIFGSDLGDDVDLGSAASSALFGDYYFNDASSKRAFVGFGIGSFQGITIKTAGNSVKGDSSLGIIPRVGYELGHVRFSGEYNLLFGDNTSNYIGIHLGITIGGGYKG